MANEKKLPLFISKWTERLGRSVDCLGRKRKKNQKTKKHSTWCFLYVMKYVLFFPVCWPQYDVLECIKNVNKIPSPVLGWRGVRESFLIAFGPSMIFLKKISVCSEGSTVYKKRGVLGSWVFFLPLLPPKRHKRGHVSQRVCIWQSWLGG